MTILRLAVLISALLAMAGCRLIGWTWTAPVGRVDGTPLSLSDIAGYEADTDPPSLIVGTAYGVTSPDNAPVCMRFRTVDTQGNRSVWSDEVCK